MRHSLNRLASVAVLGACAFSWLLPGGFRIPPIGIDRPGAVEVAPRLHEGSPWAAFLAPEGTCRGDGRPAGDESAQLYAMRCLLDWARRQRGLPPLPMDAALTASAKLKAEAIVRCRDFSHTPCGRPFSETLDAVGWRGAAGENIAWGASLAGSPRVLVDGWLHSQGHRENLFRPTWRAQGLAVFQVDEFLGDGPAAIWVHQFGS